MKESFKVRVDRVFGSIPLSSSSSSSRSSGWTVSDDEIERREWNRDRGSPDRENTPCSSSFDECFMNQTKNPRRNSKILRKRFEDDLDDLDDDEEEEEEERDTNRSVERNECEREDFEIRSSIGLDPTLDNEDEEDEYDKVAVGSENVGDRLYMKDVTDYGPYLNCHNVLPESFEEIKNAGRDPRANHLAARARLKEDNETVGGVDPLQACDEGMPVVDSQAKLDSGNVKSILKRKESQMESKPKKRVRFDPGCIEDHNEELMETTNAEESSLPEDSHGVPDYIRNPAKYIHYTFDSLSADDNDESNLHAYREFCNTVVKMSACANLQSEGTQNLPKSITFTPKKKPDSATNIEDNSETKQRHEDASMEPMGRAVCTVGIAAGEAQISEACAMEEDDPETSVADKSSRSQKPNRRYRSKGSSDDSI